jgi:hypothetical protein
MTQRKKRVYNRSVPNTLVDEREFARAMAQTPERRKKPIDFMYLIKKKELIQVENLTICILHLFNGFKVQGQAACLVESQCDYDVSSRLAYESALSKLWEYWAFFMAEWRFMSRRQLKQDVLKQEQQIEEETPDA